MFHSDLLEEGSESSWGCVDDDIWFIEGNAASVL